MLAVEVGQGMFIYGNTNQRPDLSQEKRPLEFNVQFTNWQRMKV